MNAIPKSVSRLIALLLLFGLTLAVYGFAVAPILASYSETDARRSEIRAQLLRFRAIADGKSQYEAQLAELDRRLASQGLTIEGATDAIAAANLQERVGSMVESAGGVLRANQSLPADQDGSFRKVGVRVQASLTTSQLARIMYRLESGRPFVFLETLEIKSRRARRRNAEEVDIDPQLVVRFDAYSFVRAEPES